MNEAQEHRRVYVQIRDDANNLRQEFAVQATIEEVREAVRAALAELLKRRSK